VSIRSSLLLVDDERMLLEAFQRFYSLRPEFQVVGTAMDAATAVEAARGLQPDIVVMDVSLPDVDGIAATRMVLAVSPGTRVVGLTGIAGRAARDMLAAGASAFVLKDAPLEELTHAIRVAAVGGRFVGSGVALDGDGVLTPREIEVLSLIADGCSAPTIAARLEVGERTVETHVEHIKQKTGQRTIADLTKWAIGRGYARLR
jgi:DNA-binding NarL/FixJ family response regulator